VLFARRAQVDVRVDEGREEVAALARDDLDVLGGLERSGRAELGDRSPPHEEVAGRVEPGAGIQDVGSPDQEIDGARGLGDERARRSPGRELGLRRPSAHADLPPTGAGWGAASGWMAAARAVGGPASSS
jgi:hypothetical protein